MANELSKTQRDFKFICLILVNRRISVKRAAEELYTTPRTIYRMVRDCSAVMPIRLESGIIIRTQPILMEEN